MKAAPRLRAPDPELDEMTCPCAHCADAHPAEIIKHLGGDAGFLVLLECFECGQATSGSVGPYRPQMLFDEVGKWNASQELQFIERQALAAEHPAPRRKMRM